MKDSSFFRSPDFKPATKSLENKESIEVFPIDLKVCDIDATLKKQIHIEEEYKEGRVSEKDYDVFWAATVEKNIEWFKPDDFENPILEFKNIHFELKAKKEEIVFPEEKQEKTGVLGYEKYSFAYQDILHLLKETGVDISLEEFNMGMRNGDLEKDKEGNRLKIEGLSNIKLLMTEIMNKLSGGEFPNNTFTHTVYPGNGASRDDVTKVRTSFKKHFASEGLLTDFHKVKIDKTPQGKTKFSYNNKYFHEDYINEPVGDFQSPEKFVRTFGGADRLTLGTGGFHVYSPGFYFRRSEMLFNPSFIFKRSKNSFLHQYLEKVHQKLPEFIPKRYKHQAYDNEGENLFSDDKSKLRNGDIDIGLPLVFHHPEIPSLKLGYADYAILPTDKYLHILSIKHADKLPRGVFSVENEQGQE